MKKLAAIGLSMIAQPIISHARKISPNKDPMVIRTPVTTPLIALLFAALLSAPAEAESFWLDSGERVDGQVVGVVGGAVTVRRTIGGLKVFKLKNLERADVRTTQGTMSGQLVGYQDGLIEILDPNGALITIAADGRVVSRTPSTETSSVRTAVTLTPDPAASTVNTREPEQRVSQQAESIDNNTDLVSVEVITSSLTIAEGSGDLEIELLVDRQDDRSVSVFYTTVSGAAASNQDFETKQGHVSIGNGSDYARIEIPIIDDDLVEDREHFLVFFSTDPSQATMSSKQIRVEVEDND